MEAREYVGRRRGRVARDGEGVAARFDTSYRASVQVNLLSLTKSVAGATASQMKGTDDEKYAAQNKIQNGITGTLRKMKISNFPH